MTLDNDMPFRYPLVKTAMATLEAAEPEVVIRPEEEQLFKEFQSYVRTIYMAASDGAIQNLNEATENLRREVGHLEKTVWDSRQNYAQLFSPAVDEFSRTTAAVLAEMKQQQASIIRESELRLLTALGQIQELVKAETAKLRRTSEEAEAAEASRSKKVFLVLSVLAVVQLLVVVLVVLKR